MLFIFTSGLIVIYPLDCTSSTPSNVILVYQCSLCLLSIDEITGTFCVPSAWTCEWPRGANRDQVQMMSPAMLIGSCMSNGGLLCLRALSNYMVQ